MPQQGFWFKIKGRRPSIIYIGFVALLLGFVSPAFGQNSLYLQHRYKPNRQAKIWLDKEYKFQTPDTTFSKYRIVAFSEQDLLISSLEPRDTVQISFDEIEKLTRVKKFGFVEAVGTVGLLCLCSAPFLWATGRGDEATDMAVIGGSLLTLTLPIIGVKRIGTKKNTKTKWAIRSR